MLKIALSMIAVICCVTVLLITLLGAAFGGMVATSGSLQQGSSLSSVATAALALQQHIFGSRSNEYDQGDPFMQSVIGYWVFSLVITWTIYQPSPPQNAKGKVDHFLQKVVDFANDKVDHLDPP